MNIFRYLKFVFSAPRVPSSHPQEAKERMRALVASRSHGNIRIQMGSFYTKEDVDSKFEQFKDVRFASES
jgi:hypothetical protein